MFLCLRVYQEAVLPGLPSRERHNHSQEHTYTRLLHAVNKTVKAVGLEGVASRGQREAFYLLHFLLPRYLAVADLFEALTTQAQTENAGIAINQTQ